jgi:hypothetical protein
MDIKVIHNIIDSTVDKIFACAAKNKIELSVDKETLMKQVRKAGERTDSVSFSLGNIVCFSESKMQTFRKELYAMLADLANTLRKYKETFPQLNAMAVIKTLATIQVKDPVTEAEGTQQATPATGDTKQPDVQKATQKKTQMGRKANEWLKKFNQLSVNSSKELQSGNIGNASSEFFSLMAQMPKQDWYQFFFKV